MHLSPALKDSGFHVFGRIILHFAVIMSCLKRLSHFPSRCGRSVVYSSRGFCTPALFCVQLSISINLCPTFVAALTCFRIPITFALNWSAPMCVNPIPPAYLDPKAMSYGKVCWYPSFGRRCRSRCVCNLSIWCLLNDVEQREYVILGL